MDSCLNRHSCRHATSGFLVALVATLGSAASLHAAESCKIEKMAELPVTIEDSAPILAAKINGKDVRLILDSGAYFSMLAEPLARSLGLKLTPGSPYGGNYMGGITGLPASMQLAVAPTFEFAGVKAKNIEFLVGGAALGGRGLLGNNLMGSWDVEYDLAHGRITLLKTTGCQNANLAYWKAPDQSSSAMEFSGKSGTEHDFRQVVGVLYLNDQRMRAMLDTGAHSTLISLVAASRAGVHTSSPGVKPAGSVAGITLGGAKSWQAPFASVKLGDNEEIRHARVRIADIELGDPDLLLGADFFLSHHVLVSRSARKIFFTYNGGAVFNIGAGEVEAAADDVPQADGAGEHETAESLATQASGASARHEYAAAYAMLGKAIEQAPQDPEYYYRRAQVSRERGRTDDALRDLDQALALRADFMPALMPRAEARLALQQREGALADLDTFDRLAGHQAAERLHLGDDYQLAASYPAAIRQYGIWLDEYHHDNGEIHAWLERCRARAIGNLQLEEALSDCNRTLSEADKRLPQYRNIYAVRGLVWLRRKNDARALADFEEALKGDKDNVYALYGRGVVRSRQGGAGTDDLDHARQKDAAAVERLVAAGLGP